MAKTINAQEFTLSSNDSYQTVSVDFAYRYWFRSALSPAVHVPPKTAALIGGPAPLVHYEKAGESIAGNLAAERALARIKAEKEAANLGPNKSPVNTRPR